DPVSVADAGDYEVVLSNLCGTLTTPTAHLTVGAPLVTSQPVGDRRCAGEAAVFSVTASGTSLTYQWRKDGTAIDGATNATFEISTVSINDAGSYDVFINSLCGFATSWPATLTVNTPAHITGSPADVVACADNLVRLSAAATSSGPLSYQWRKDGIDIAGADSSTYTIAAATWADAG